MWRLKWGFGEWEVVFAYALFEFLAQEDDMCELLVSFSRKEAGGSRPCVGRNFFLVDNQKFVDERTVVGEGGCLCMRLRLAHV